MFAMSKTFAAAWVSVLALVATACGDDPAKVENLFLKVTSDAPTGGGDLESLRVLFVKGDVRFPVDASQSEFNPTLGDLDPVAGPVYLSIRYDGETFGSNPTGVTLQVTGRIAGKPVVAFEGLVDLADNVILPVHMDALGAACDADGDGFFDCGVSGCCVTDSVLGDCAPDSADGSPWGTEDPCEDTDAIDNDCQGGDIVPANTDGDPFNDCKETACGADASRDDVYPGATELCDARDNDCDGSTDEGLTLATPGGNLALGADCGLGKCAGGEVQCDGAGAVECSTADQANPTEGCEGADDDVDDDCDGLTDEGCDVNIVDIDGDGVASDTDCDDFDPGRYPGNIVPEACCDPAAQNDAAARAACDHNCNDADITYCEANDEDGDGFTVAEGDCDDDPSDDTLFPARLIYPGAEEKCGDTVDQDCLLGDLACTGLTDVDQDGWPASVDCNDGDNTIKPDAPEVCNGKDDDCDTLIDDGNPGGGESCGSDVGECATGTTVCVRALPEGEGCLAGQAPCFVCPNDVEPVAETCNGKDDNCADGTDETFEYASAGIGEPCDGVGACGQGTVECVAGDVTQATCSTNPNGSASQAQTEVCDALDNDCDGTRNEDLTDVDDSDCDRDGVCGANLQMVHATCLEAGGWSCDYTDVPDWENERETLCDGKDNDCDGGSDEDITFVDAQGATRNVLQGCDGSDADSCSNGTGRCDPGDVKKAFCDESNAASQVELCDNEDNDCDGKVDEDFKAGADADPTKALSGAAYSVDNGKYLTKADGSAQTCGTGTCGVGQVRCSPIDPTKLTCTTPSQPTEDFCDSLDNDCNGTADDRYVTGGDRPYNGGPYIDNPNTPAPNDGDQGKFKGAACGTGSCSGGVVICATLTELKCDKVPAVLATDVCDDIDNDCDGTTDDIYLANAPAAQKVVLANALFTTDNGKSKFATCGTGECSGGEVVCNAAHDGLVCDSNGESQTETCEGLDDSCNGSTDEGFPNLDGDAQANCVDGDDDNDGLADGPDACELGVTGWTSNTTTDHDGDGCQDANAEDGDDDNDGVLDGSDRCAKGNLGWTSSLSTDYDLDGCQDTPTVNDEDTDEDNDNILDVNDTCRRGDKGWLSTKGTAQAPGTDWDQDGCQDSSTEDGDDDNDSALDAADRCDPDASGASDLGANGSTIGWTRTVGTSGAPGSDWDDDGCQDSGEDADDDNDGAADTADRCDPDASGPTADTGAIGSTKGWARTIGTAGTPGSDWDDDGCQDSGEDADDDNDAALDTADRCDPDASGANDLGANGSTKDWTRTVGTAGAPGSDWDDDGCQDSGEDTDDDNDTAADTADRCDPDASGPSADTGAVGSTTGWTRTVGTAGAPGSDWDDDGCQDSGEDTDDDNDAALDTADRCDPDATGPTGDTGAVGSTAGWTRTIGTAGAPGSDWDDDGCQDSGEDTDDDNDAALDGADRCDPDASGANDLGANGSAKGWTRTVGTAGAPGSDWDDDGCQDSGEDADDDNDTKADDSDRCDPDATLPTADTGISGSTKDWTRTIGTAGAPGSDWDDDGCQDSGEDTDDDNDALVDTTDRCDPDATGTNDLGANGSTKDWTRTVGTTGAPGSDWDDDGCQDSGEDTDDDNDTKADDTDRCDPDNTGANDLGINGSTKDWTRTVGTAGAPGSDWDDDGCQDSAEDTDDDNDGLADTTDRCDPDATGANDLGANGSTKDWTRTVGTAGAPGSDWDDDGCQDSSEDTDDDNDGLADGSDRCDPDAAGGDDIGTNGSTRNWTRTEGTTGAPGSDWDQDGCQDSGEDADDDNDTVADGTDRCDPDNSGTGDTGAVGSQRAWTPTLGTTGAPGSDWDQDGCRDADEDGDDDNDELVDGSDNCDPDASGPAGDSGAVGSDKGWTSAEGTALTPGSDWDLDGCQDSGEDTDDDNDGLTDATDRCDPDATGANDLGANGSTRAWTRTEGTTGAPGSDWDQDGCQDSGEDGDDDNDGAADGSDRCDPDATGTGDTGVVGSTRDWTRTEGTAGAPGSDWDLDGCQDSVEDTDDDNDGLADGSDRCDPDAGSAPDLGAQGSTRAWSRSEGTPGAPGSDWDGDGCQDSGEDTDDDNDGAADDADRCDPDAATPTGDTGVIGSERAWTRTEGTAGAPGSDWDLDGCEDATEDEDDDNDTSADEADRCDPDNSGTGDTGAVGSTRAWTPTEGTTGTPGSDWDLDGCQDSGEDTDDDNDGLADASDDCDPDAPGGTDFGANGSTRGWTRTEGTAGAPGSDWDLDGCQDGGEDTDDDNDTIGDATDRCDPDNPGGQDTGAVGSDRAWVPVEGTPVSPGSDWELDGCQDATEDTDDDNDTLADGSDRCDPDAGTAPDTGAVGSSKAWTSAKGTTGAPGSDWDVDGCEDATEDPDDDNDTLIDADDDCDPDNGGAGDAVLGSTTDWDGQSRAADLDADGCKDGDPGAEDTCVDADVDGWGRTGFPDSGCANGAADDCNDTAGNTADVDRDNVCEPGDTCVDADEDGWGRAGFTDSGCAQGTADDCNDTAGNTVDGDHDNVCDPSDNCAAVANADQANNDSDANGDACDTCTDADSDGFGRSPQDRSGCSGGTGADCNDTVGNSEDLDKDNICDTGVQATCTNGANTACDDNCPVDSNTSQADSNNNGIGNVCDPCTAGNGEDFDVCGDCLDNDCDGNSDATDAEGCVYRRILGIETGPSGVAAGYSVSLTFDHAFLVTAGRSTASGNDVRVYYRNPSTGAIDEIDRVLDPESTWNSTTTKIWFKSQDVIMADVGDGDEVNTDYYLYASVTSGSPKASENVVFQFADFFDRANSTTVGPDGSIDSPPVDAWAETQTTNGLVNINTNSLNFATASTGENMRPVAYRVFTSAITAGRWLWRTKWNWERDTSGSPDSSFATITQLGDSASSFNASPTSGTSYPTTGVGPAVLWARTLFGFEAAGVGDLGFTTGGGTPVVTIADDEYDGSSEVAVIVDMAAKTFTIDPDGDLAGFTPNIGFQNNGLTRLDSIRLISHSQDSASFDTKRFDYVLIRRLPPAGEQEPYAYIGVKEPLGPACVIGGTALTRWYLDDDRDDPLGFSATTLSDAVTTPLDLTLAAAGGLPALVSAGTMHGLFWSAAGVGGTAAVAYDGSKLTTGGTGLHNSTTATIEAVIEVLDTATDSFIVDLQRATGEHQLALTASTSGSDTYQLKLYFNDAVVGNWAVHVPRSGRSVYTVVIDTTQATAGNRLRLYRDGFLLTVPNSATPPLQDAQIDLGNPGTLRVGNNAAGTTSPLGYVYHVSLYRAALSASQVGTNAAILRADDDRR